MSKAIYSRSTDPRTFGMHVLAENFLDVIVNGKQCKEVEEARKRVSRTEGRYQYTPSEEYKAYKAQQDLAKLRIRKTI